MLVLSNFWVTYHQWTRANRILYLVALYTWLRGYVVVSLGSQQGTR
jgi:hypothetical protein